VQVGLHALLVLTLSWLVAACAAAPPTHPQPVPDAGTSEPEPVGTIEPDPIPPAAPPSCPPQCIANTEVADTPRNRKVIEFCEAYRHAIERHDAGALLAFASPRYRDDVGTPDPSDDIGYDDLEQLFRERFSEVEAMHYEVRYRGIAARQGTLFVDLTYSASFKMSGQWRRHVADGVLELETVGDTFAIVSGM
jgi:hypothetical protein